MDTNNWNSRLHESGHIYPQSEAEQMGNLVLYRYFYQGYSYEYKVI